MTYNSVSLICIILRHSGGHLGHGDDGGGTQVIAISPSVCHPLGQLAEQLADEITYIDIEPRLSSV